MEETQTIDNSDEIQRNSIKTPANDTSTVDIINNTELSLNLTENITQQLHEFETILNNRRSELNFNENDSNLDEINDIVNQHLINNEELTRNDIITTGNIDSIVDLIDSTTSDIDVISIGSTDSQISSSGYQSSDFEFITELEAKRDGFIINFKGTDDPGEGPSGLNKKGSASSRLGRHTIPSVLNEYIDRSSNILKYKKPSFFNYGDRRYRNNHEIPEGGNYLNLFQGIYDPMLQEIHFLENKSIKTSVMNVEYDGIGFDQQLFGKPRVPDSSDDEFEDEAKETTNKILSMYPHENNKRRRRH